MLSLIHALGGLGRSVTDSARHALTSADGATRWRKLALYVVMFALPGGSIAVLFFAWAEHRRALRKRAGAAEAAPLASLCAPCAGGQPACRAAAASAANSARPTHATRAPKPPAR